MFPPPRRSLSESGPESEWLGQRGWWLSKVSSERPVRGLHNDSPGEGRGYHAGTGDGRGDGGDCRRETRVSYVPSPGYPCPARHVLTKTVRGRVKGTSSRIQGERKRGERYGRG